jgi:hypothetical protein
VLPAVPSKQMKQECCMLLALPGEQEKLSAVSMAMNGCPSCCRMRGALPHRGCVSKAPASMWMVQVCCCCCCCCCCCRFGSDVTCVETCQWLAPKGKSSSLFRLKLMLLPMLGVKRVQHHMYRGFCLHVACWSVIIHATRNTQMLLRPCVAPQLSVEGETVSSGSMPTPVASPVGICDTLSQ